MRILNVLLVSCLIALAFVIYDVKYDTRDLDARVAALRLDIRKERDGIAILRAEWGHLNRPARMERLARKHLGLAPMQAHQMITREQLSGALLELKIGPLARKDGRALRQPVSAIQ